MAAKRGKSELITGVFAAIVVAAVLFVVLYLQGFSPAVQGTRYLIIFDDIGGLSGSAGVIVAGQRVGRVDGIRTLQTTSPEKARGIEVEVQIVIDEKFTDTIKIPVDTKAKIQSGGLFGGTDQIVLRLGAKREIVAAGQRLPERGEEPTSFNKLFDGAAQTMKDANEAVKKLIAVIGTDQFRDNLDRTAQSLAEATDKLNKGLAELQPAFGKVEPAVESAEKLLESIRTLIEQNNASINALVKNLESASGRLDLLLADNKDGVPQLVRSLNGIAGNLDGLVANLNDLVLDNQINIQVALQNIRDASASLRVFTRRIERDPSLLVWGDSEDEKDRAKLDAARPVPNVDELSIRNSGRRPRKESD